MKILSKISIMLLSLLACGTFSCKKELAPISASSKNAALLPSVYGQVTTVFTGPTAYGLAIDAALNIYVADEEPERLLKITPDSVMAPWPYLNYYFLGIGVNGITFGPDSALYFADPNFNLVRRITLGGALTTVAGQEGIYMTHNDGPVAQATFGYVQKITSCAEGNLYVTEINFYPPNDIRVITPGAGGIVYTLYKADKPGSISPWAIAIHLGIVYFSDNSNTIAKIALDGTVSTFATGIAAYDLAFDSSGNLYASDGVQNKIFKITPDGMVSTLAGSGAAGSADGVGTDASFNQPAGLTVHGDYLYVGDVGNRSIRKIKIK
jgi:hypothetical protein